MIKTLNNASALSRGNPLTDYYSISFSPRVARIDLLVPSSIHTFPVFFHRPLY